MRWPAYRHVFFDCDSTLTAVEGIDVLADLKGRSRTVAGLTKDAMEGKIGLGDVYGQRLQEIEPSRGELRQVLRAYKQNVVEDARDVIDCLQALGHHLYIISGGLAEPVREFGVSLGIPAEHIRAVKIDYDQLSGRWWETAGHYSENTLSQRYLSYEANVLASNHGKARVIAELSEGGGRALLVGDGYSDLEAASSVDLFVGYAGVVRRERVIDKAPLSIQCRSLAPLLAIAAGPAAVTGLVGGAHDAVARKAQCLIRDGGLKFGDGKLEERFYNALSATGRPR